MHQLCPPGLNSVLLSLPFTVHLRIDTKFRWILAFLRYVFILDTVFRPRTLPLSMTSLSWRMFRRWPQYMFLRCDCIVLIYFDSEKEAMARFHRCLQDTYGFKSQGIHFFSEYRDVWYHPLTLSKTESSRDNFTKLINLRKQLYSEVVMASNFKCIQFYWSYINTKRMVVTSLENLQANKWLTVALITNRQSTK